ncbi:hypothetical protein [Actinoplanes sp. N902-109]|uniref:hypothetical protein n=1 Tax=Actinoplanes sp. (strain N902-109) TaxID=649831 RepID=UPI00039B1C83|nr:hypothetical protein [Actinoplanes sp. N902-109]
MNQPERRKVSLAGLGLISAGAVLGLTLAGPGSQQDDSAAPRPATTTPADPPAADPPATLS